MENQTLMWSILVVALLAFVTSGLVLMQDDPVIPTPTVPAAQISDQDKADIVNAVIASRPAPVEVSDTPEASNGLDADDKAYLEDLSDLDEERKALEVALTETETRDFKRALRSALNRAGADIEDYKDITSIEVKDSDADVDGEEAEVEFEIKVRYFNDGDNDEEDELRGKVIVTILVEDLDSDDNFEDAEAVETIVNEVVYYDRD